MIWKPEMNKKVGAQKKAQPLIVTMKIKGCVWSSCASAAHLQTIKIAL